MTNLTGSWRHGSAVLEIDDGTLQIGGRTFVQRIEEDLLLLFPCEAQLAIPFNVEGDVLVLDVDGRRSEWQRILPRCNRLPG